MEIDIRVTRRRQLEAVAGLPFHAVSIGDEYCPHRLPDENELFGMIDLCEKEGWTWKWVTPFLSNEAAGRVIQMASRLLERVAHLHIVVNDYGFLQELTRIGAGRSYSVIMGQMLVHSLEEFQWAQDIVGQENDFIKRNWMMNSYTSGGTLEYFRTAHHLEGVELSLLPYAVQSGAFIQSRGISVHYVDKLFPMAVARKCHQAEFHKALPSAACSSLCEKPYIVKLQQTYSISDPKLKYLDAPECLKDQISDWIIFGNGTFKEYAEPIEPSGLTGDGVVLDVRYYKNMDELSERIRYYQGQGGGSHACVGAGKLGFGG